MSTIPTGVGRVWMSPPTLYEAARRAEELLDELDRLRPAHLAPANDALVGHAELGRALTEASQAWNRALRAISGDVSRIIDELGPNAASTQRVDQDVAEELAGPAAPLGAGEHLAAERRTAIGTNSITGTAPSLLPRITPHGVPRADSLGADYE